MSTTMPDTGERRSIRRRLAAPFRLSWPVLRRLLREAALLVPAHAIVGGALLWAAARLLAGRWDDASGLAAFGGWSLAALYGLVGAVGGAFAGAVGASARTLSWIGGHAESWILDLPTGEDPGGSVVSLDEVAANVDRVADAALGRLPAPRLVRRLAKARLRAALLDDFLVSCRARGLTAVGRGEVRNWLLSRGLDRALEPARAQLSLWRTLTLAGLGLAALVPAASAALAGVLEPVAIVLSAFALAGVAILAWGLPRASLRERPAHWRAGMLILGASLAGWPAVYAWLWSRGVGLAWLAAAAVTWITVRRGFDEAFVRAGPPRRGGEGAAGVRRTGASDDAC